MKILRFLPLLLAFGGSLLAANVPHVTPAEAARRVAKGEAVLVDVREPREWAETGVAEPAVLLPKSDFDGPRKSWAPFLEQNRRKEIILYCRTGRRAAAVAGVLAHTGYHVANAGGFTDWTGAGLPVRDAKGK